MTSTFLLLLALSPAALGSSEPQREALLFQQADLNHDGQLNEGELRQIFLDFDTNHDSDITKEEFQADWSTVYGLGNNQEAATLFTKADTNGDGILSDDDLPAIFAYFDMDGSNQVDLNEFLTQWGDLELNAPDVVTIHVGN